MEIFITLVLYATQFFSSRKFRLWPFSCDVREAQLKLKSTLPNKSVDQGRIYDGKAEKETRNGSASSECYLVSLATSCDTPRQLRRSSGILKAVHQVEIPLRASIMTAFGKRTDIEKACYSFCGLTDVYSKGVRSRLGVQSLVSLKKTTVVARATTTTKERSESLTQQ